MTNDECSNCTGGLHRLCSPPCGCGCPTSIERMKMWRQKNTRWL